MKLNKFNAKSIVVNVLNSDTRINKCNVYVGSHPSENYPIIAGSFLHNDKELYFYTYFDNIEFNTIVVKGLMDRIIKIYNSFCDNDIVFHEDRLFEICFARNFVLSEGFFPGPHHKFWNDIEDIVKSKIDGKDIFDKILNIDLNNSSSLTSYNILA